MTKVGLSRKLSQDTGEVVSPAEAQELIDGFNEVYSSYANWKESVIEKYSSEEYIRLPDGWVMWGENDNHRSVTNLPTQGVGAVIMRKAVALAQDRGLLMAFTLHDALYILYKSYDWQALQTLADCMMDAVKFYFPGNPDAGLMGLDVETWSPDYASIKGTEVSFGTLKKIAVDEIHIDERAVSEYKKFSKYFYSDDEFL